MIDNILDSIKEELINIRRHIHQNPEMAFCEYNTAEIICNYLNKLNIKYDKNIAKTGVVGLIKGKKGGKTLLLRADMDALPLLETNTHNFISQNHGIMHACGHDVHTTILLGVAKVLSKLSDEFSGNIKLVFQPGEEASGGALPMIEEGVLENPKVDGAFAFHIWDSVEAGKVIVKYDGIMASPDHFSITIKGKGGHGAKPEQCISPIKIGSEIVCELNKIQTNEPSVISICTFDSGNSENVIPNEAILKGTARTLDKITRQQVYNRICNVANNVCKKYGGSCIINYRFLYPPCVNDNNMVDLFIKSASNVIGKENIIMQEKPDMIGEDFAYFAENVPSCLVKLGGALSPLHTSNFDVDEVAINFGVKLMAKFALDYLK